MENKNRDKTLDYLRGFAIIQVVLVHILYWLGIFSEGFSVTAKSFFLFEMPVFFFVTGAVNSLGGQQKYKTFCFKRIKGLLFPYYVYSAICILVSVAYYILHNRFTAKLIIQLLLTWIVPLDHQMTPLSYLTWAIWFIPVYVITVFLFPLIQSAVLKFGWRMIICLIAVFAGIEMLCTFIHQNTSFEGYAAGFYTALDILQKSFFYLIFMGLGVLYPRLKNRSRKGVITATAILILSIILLLVCKTFLGDTLDMQTNKFPPNHMFLFYSFAVLCALYIAKPLLKRGYLRMTRCIPILDKWVLLFSHNSIYVFLYQTFSFLIIDIFLRLLKVNNDYLVFAIALVTVYPMIWLSIRLINCIRTIKKAG